jgi:hypothetical protein
MGSVMKAVLVLTTLTAFFCVSILSADPSDILWEQICGGDGHDAGYCVQQTSDGGYIVAGETSGLDYWDMYVVKTDAGGDTMWTRTYGGPELDDAQSVQETSSGGYIVFGRTISFGAGENDYYLVRIDEDGNPLWAQPYGGSGNDWGYSARETSDGGYILAGNSMSFGGLADIYLVKTDEDGDTLWTRTYGGDSWEEGYCVRQTDDGGYIVAGSTTSFGGGGSDVYLVKTDADGDPVWTQAYGGANLEAATSVQEVAGGGYIITGYTESFGAGQSDLWLLRTDAEGDTLWTRTFGGELRDYGEGVWETWDGGYVTGGYTESFGMGGFDAYVVRTDADGHGVWVGTYGGADSDGASYIEETADGGVVFTGWVNSSLSHPSNLWLVRLEGNPLPAVTAELTPDDPPVTVPRGGSFGFSGTVTNNSVEAVSVDCWTMVQGPLGGIAGPFVVIYDLPLAAGQARHAHLNQSVPGKTPLGSYHYIAYVGEYPTTVLDSAWFEAEVVEGAGAGAGDWILTGTLLE